jgi:hypothetical protein
VTWTPGPRTSRSTTGAPGPHRLQVGSGHPGPLRPRRPGRWLTGDRDPPPAPRPEPPRRPGRRPPTRPVRRRHLRLAGPRRPAKRHLPARGRDRGRPTRGPVDNPTRPSGRRATLPHRGTRHRRPGFRRARTGPRPGHRVASDRSRDRPDGQAGDRPRRPRHDRRALGAQEPHRAPPWAGAGGAARPARRAGTGAVRGCGRGLGGGADRRAGAAGAAGAGWEGGPRWGGWGSRGDPGGGAREDSESCPAGRAGGRSLPEGRRGRAGALAAGMELWPISVEPELLLLPLRPPRLPCRWTWTAGQGTRSWWAASRCQPSGRRGPASPRRGRGRQAIRRMA